MTCACEHNLLVNAYRVLWLSPQCLVCRPDNSAGTVLYLKTLPLDLDVLGFDYLDRPDEAALEDALRQLFILDAIDKDGR